MAEVIGVRFREIGKIDIFSPGEETFHRGDHVVAETARGVEYGTVVLGNYQICDREENPPRQILRRATAEDDERVKKLKEKEESALKVCRQKAAQHQLDMKVISSEYTFDSSKLLFYFTADGRVDFRELVKDLASVFHMRIELRQVGVRDETKLIGGMGSCGRPLCCSTWLSDFVPVSIKMAKEQSLSLNPQKISGVCGRLMCCLKNEADTYAFLHSQLPKKGDMVELADGKHGEIMEVNVLKQTVKVFMILDGDEREIREIPASETVFLAHRKKGQPSQMKKEAMARREAALQEAKKHVQKRAEERGRSSARINPPEAERRTEVSTEGAVSAFAERMEIQGNAADAGAAAETASARGESAEGADSAAEREERRRHRRRPRPRRKEEAPPQGNTAETGSRGNRTGGFSEKSAADVERPASMPEHAEAAQGGADAAAGGKDSAPRPDGRPRRRRRRRPVRPFPDAGGAGSQDSPGSQGNPRSQGNPGSQDSPGNGPS